MFAIKQNLKEAWQKAMHLNKHWVFAPNICKILPPLNVRCGMKKKAIQCLMKCLKEVGIHV